MQVDSRHHIQRTMLQNTSFQKISTDTQHPFLLGHLPCLTRSTCCLAFPPGTKNTFGDCWADTCMQLVCHLHLAIIFIATMNSMFTCPAFLEKKYGIKHKLSSLLPQRRCFQTTSMCSGLHLWALSVFQHLAHGFGTEIKKEDPQCLKLFVIPRLISFPPRGKT